MSQERTPLVLRLMDRGRGKGPDPLQETEATGASVIRPRRKLRLLRAHAVRFIRGPRDVSPWREAGRRELLGNGSPPAARVWKNPAAGLRRHPRPGIATDPDRFSGRTGFNR